MLLFKRMKREIKTEEALSQSDFDLMQQENDQMLDQIEALKLDISDLETENKRLLEQLTRSKYQRSLIKTSMGLGALVASYILLHLINEEAQYTAMLLSIEAVFMFVMLRGDDQS
ncbi:hypothetical protein D0501_03830 [Leuconostoc holzapfelii]|uniref:Uncharacterized protein n=1 Tax=Leuconostoc holzapfelii TaxID=434464 RepID=A0A846ZFT6_9LACO|nr:hypothetical protein [Leuconostoc holzapfelii]MCT8389203.1 hypothetical protein [Leuconostoc holzapfelii]NKZ18061.1 hypothetical protein [Leuconostoc holzapfelii]